LAAGSVNVRFLIGKATFELIAAAQNDPFAGYVSFEIRKLNKLDGSKIVA